MEARNDRFVIYGDHKRIAERLENYSIPEPNTGCFLCFSVNGAGYGSLALGGVNGSRVLAHRAAYILAKGPIGRKRTVVVPDRRRVVEALHGITIEIWKKGETAL